MNNICWEVFKKTGSIEAYLYLKEYSNMSVTNEEIREISINYDDNQYPGDSFKGCEI